MDQKNKIDDLEHKLLEEKIETISVKLHSGFEVIENAINKGFELLKAENKRQNDISAIQRKEILRKQDVTNGRVTKLEEVTSFIRLMRENKKFTALVLYAIYNILEVSTVENVINVYRWIKLMI